MALSPMSPKYTVWPPLRSKSSLSKTYEIFLSARVVDQRCKTNRPEIAPLKAFRCSSVLAICQIDFKELPGEYWKIYKISIDDV